MTVDANRVSDERLVEVLDYLARMPDGGNRHWGSEYSRDVGKDAHLALTELLSRRSLDDGAGVEKPKHVGRCGYPDCGGECVGCEQGDAERVQLASRPSRNAEVGVKALEWRKLLLPVGGKAASTPFGDYIVRAVYGTEGELFSYCLEGNKRVDGWPSIEAAKAAAQADYDARILSAIVGSAK